MQWMNDGRCCTSPVADSTVDRPIANQQRTESDSQQCAWATVSLPLSLLRPIRNKSVPIQLTQSQFPAWAAAISNDEMLTYFWNKKIYVSNFIKQYSETAMVWNYQNADSSLRQKYCVIIITFGTLSFPGLNTAAIFLAHWSYFFRFGEMGLRSLKGRCNGN